MNGAFYPLWEENRIDSMIAECNVIIIEDYNKGVLHSNLIKKIIQKSRNLAIPIVVDPKKKNFLCYKNATLFKPNLKEIKEGLKLDFESSDVAAIAAAVDQLIEKLNIDTAMVTLSERGIFIKNKTESYHLPAHVRSVSDVSGAGDTVISIAALCVGLGLPAQATAALSNLGGGLVCEYQGVVPIDKNEFYKEALREGLWPG